MKRYATLSHDLTYFTSTFFILFIHPRTRKEIEVEYVRSSENVTYNSSRIIIGAGPENLGALNEIKKNYVVLFNFLLLEKKTSYFL